MSITVQIRHSTRGLTPDGYWVGFIAHHKANSDKGPIPRLSTVEINQLNLGLSEERRRSGGFEFPLALYKFHDLAEEESGQKTVVTRLYAKMLSPAQAFASLEGIQRIELLIAKRQGTLADLGEPATLAVYRDDAIMAYKNVLLNESWWQYQAVTCTLYDSADGSALSLVDEPHWTPAPAFKNTIASFIEASEAAALRGLNARRARAGSPPAASVPDPVPELVKVKPISSPTPGGREPEPLNTGVERIDTGPKPKPQSKPKNLLWVVTVVGAALVVLQFNKPPAAIDTAILPFKTAPTIAAPSLTPDKTTAIPVPTPAVVVAPEQFTSVPPISDPVAVAPTAPAASETEPGKVAVPSGNSISTRDDLYKFGFDGHLTMVKKMLVAARELNRDSFDLYAEWLKTNRPAATTWPEANAKERREFNGRIASMVNHGKTVGDTDELKSSVALSEKFLMSHFGYSTSHLNLSIAQSALDNGKSALPPAFHTIVFNPDGVNGWVALGLALARSGDTSGATDAFCAALRKSGFTEKTLSYFGTVAKGEDMAYPEVTESMKRAMTTACPRSQWN